MKINLLIICSDSTIITKIQPVMHDFPEINYLIKNLSYQNLKNFLISTRDQFDALLVHGIFNQPIAEETGLPTYYLRENTTDILMTIKLGQNNLHQTIIYTTDSLYKETKQVIDSLDVTIPIIAIHSWEHLTDELNKLSEKEYSTLITDSYLYPITRLTAYETLTYLISSETINRLIKHIIEVMLPIKKIKFYNSLLKYLLTKNQIDYLIYDDQQQLLFEHDTLHFTLPISPSILDLSNQNYETEEDKFVFENQIYHLYSKKKKQNIVELVHPAVTLHSLTKFNDLLPNNYLRPVLNKYLDNIKFSKIASNYSSFFVYGNVNTLKSLMGIVISQHNNLTIQNYYLIDCRRLDSNWWILAPILLSQYNSRYIFQHTECLSEFDQDKLIQVVNNNLQNDLSYCVYLYETEESNTVVRNSIYYQSFPIRMLNLNEYVDFEVIIRLMTHHYCQIMDKTIFHYDQPALELLESYHWHLNFAQLEAVIKWIVASNEEIRVTANRVKESLKIVQMNQFKKSYLKDATVTNNLKLDEYIQEIIQTKLKEFGNNKEKTLQALNISRSRLNCYLK